MQEPEQGNNLPHRGIQAEQVGEVMVAVVGMVVVCGTLEDSKSWVHTSMYVGKQVSNPTQVRDLPNRIEGGR